MALVECPECAAQVSDQAPACPRCGHPFHSPTPTPTTRLLIAAGALLVAAAFGAGAYALLQGDARSEAASVPPETSTTNAAPSQVSDDLDEICGLVLDRFEPTLDTAFALTDTLAVPADQPARIRITYLATWKDRYSSQIDRVAQGLDEVVTESAALLNTGNEYADEVLDYARSNRTILTTIRAATDPADMAAAVFDNRDDFEAYEVVLERCRAARY